MSILLCACSGLYGSGTPLVLIVLYVYTVEFVKPANAKRERERERERERDYRPSVVHLEVKKSFYLTSAPSLFSEYLRHETNSFVICCCFYT